MPLPIRIVLGDHAVAAELDDNAVCQSVYRALPFDTEFNTWGDEIYFTIPLSLSSSTMVETVALGDIGYWPPGKAFCIFYGATPMSGPGEIRPASEIIPLGRVIDDPAVFKALSRSSATIRIEQA